MKDDLNLIKTNTSKQLLNLIEQVKSAKIIQEKNVLITSVDIRTDNNIDLVLDNLKCFKNKSKNFIYMFKLKNHDKQIYKIFNDIMTEFRDQNKEIKFSRILNNVDCKSLYIGSSSTNLRSRIKTHIGYKSVSTYALHLHFWYPAIENSLLELKIIQLNEDLPFDALEAIENSYWEHYQPLFGKKGGK
jgi:hypothetical protein